MKRCLFTILSALSLLLFVAVVVLWVRSRPWNGDVVAYGFGGRRFEIASTAGVLALTAGEARGGGTTAGGFEFVEEKSVTITLWLLLKSQDDGNSLHRMGFGHFPSPASSTVMAPHWFVALALSVLPLWRALRALGDRRRGRLDSRRGHCRSCGYDLRATPGRCPECGAVGDSAGVEKARSD